MKDLRLLIVGDSQAHHMGAYLFNAAEELGFQSCLLDTQKAYSPSRWVNRFFWHLRSHRPARGNEFNRQAVSMCKSFKPHVLIATGLAPLDRKVLLEIGGMGIVRVNYLTDDPWSRAHRSRWFISALPAYDSIFSVRESNLNDLRTAGCRQVHYLPFGYAAESHFAEEGSEEEQRRFKFDVLFIGGADSDRVPFIKALIKEGYRVGLYGGYWERYCPEQARGMADLRTVRLATRHSKISLCLVRRSNRDGNVMRSFEIPAMGGCMVSEDTIEHRRILGDEGQAALYFKNVPEMLRKVQHLLTDERKRQYLAKAAQTLVLHGKHSYKDRLQTMFEIAAPERRE